VAQLVGQRRSPRGSAVDELDARRVLERVRAPERAGRPFAREGLAENLAPLFFHTTASDVARLVAVMMADDGSFLPAGAFAAARDLGDDGTRRDGSRRVTYGTFAMVDRGLGHEILVFPGVPGTGAASAILAIPERRFAAVVLANDERAGPTAIALEAVRQWFPELPDPPRRGDPSGWDDYVGTYVAGDGAVLTVTVEDGSLLLGIDRPGAVWQTVLVPESAFASPFQPGETTAFAGDHRFVMTSAAPDGVTFALAGSQPGPVAVRSWFSDLVAWRRPENLASAGGLRAELASGAER
jgi:hypothetical protein